VRPTVTAIQTLISIVSDLGVLNRKKFLFGLNYSVYIIGENGTIALVLTGRTKLAYELQLHHRTIIDAAFHYCLRQYTCGGQNVCTTFPDTMSILHYVNSCLTSQGLIDELGYPPNASIGKSEIYLKTNRI
jgi:hypothetical protein